MKTAVGLAMIGSLPLERSYFCLIAFAPVTAKKALHCQPSGNEGVFTANNGNDQYLLKNSVLVYAEEIIVFGAAVRPRINAIRKRGRDTVKNFLRESQFWVVKRSILTFVVGFC